MRLARNLTVAIILGICAVLAVDGYLSVKRQMAAFESDMRQDHITAGMALSRVVSLEWNAGEEGEALAILEEANRSNGAIRMRWVRLDSPPGGEQSPKAPAQILEELPRKGFLFWMERTPSPGTLFSYFHVPIRGPRSGALELSESLKMSNDFARASIVQTFVFTGVIILVSGMIAGLLGVWFVGRPMSELVEKARRVGRGDLSGPLRTHRRDEIGELANEMNLMCEQLDVARGKLDVEIAERMKVQDELRHADRLSTVGKLASGMAHELGTPLNVISGRALMIARGELAGKELLSNAQVIAEQADRMTRLIRQLLDFARRRKPERSKADLCEIVSRTLMVLQTLAAKRNLKLEYRGGVVPILAEVDEVQIQQVVTNLVVNAIQATETNGVVTVDVLPPYPMRNPVQPGREINAVAIRVRDQGKGIPPEEMGHIFEPFFTTKEVGEGSGLGLSVSYGLIQEHGGWIDVHSELGRGSLFSAYLPVSVVVV
jgi:signal transduction histidine kinase